jgi:hypothetical protein
MTARFNFPHVPLEPPNGVLLEPPASVTPILEVDAHGIIPECEKQEVFPTAATDGFTAIRDKTVRGHIYSGKFIFFKNALYRGSF